MKLTEGAKVSQKLVQAALDDPQITLGVEVEFYITGVGKFLQQIHSTSTSVNPQSGWVEKKLQDLAWHDLLKFFVPLDVSPMDQRDNPTVIKERLRELFHKNFPDEKTPVKFSDMFNRLRERYGKSYQMMAALKVYPEHGLNVDGIAQKKIHQMIEQTRFAQLVATYGRSLDDQSFRMYREDEAIMQTDARGDDAVREVLYQGIADKLTEFLGEQVVVVQDSNLVSKETQGYRTWAITVDESLTLHDQADMIGLELVSPVKQVQDGLSVMRKLLRGLNDFDRIIPGMQAVTTKDTGFHINLGFGKREIDYVKMLFLMGDEHIAQEYGRLQYRNLVKTPMYVQTFKQMLRSVNTNKAAMIELLARLEVNHEASERDIQKFVTLFREAVPFDKYQSVNFTKLKFGFIEFRSAGNQDYHKNVDKLSRTVLHLAVMVYIGVTPEVYRREYLTKLYRAIMNVAQSYLPKHPETPHPRVTQAGITDVIARESQSMIRLLHVTPTRNVQSILQHGLVPQIGTRSQQIEAEAGIHLFQRVEEMEDAVMNWLGDEFDADEQLTVLQVTIPEDAVRPDPFYPGSIYISDKPIAPSSIKVLDYEL